MRTASSSIRRVVIVGAGFGGLTLARELAGKRHEFDVTLIDKHNYHTFQPLLYQVATAGLNPQDIGHSVRGIFHRRNGISFRVGEVAEVDLDAKRVGLAGGGDLPYDVLVLAPGAVTNDYGIPGVAEHAFPLKSLAESVALRNHILSQFEQAEADPDVVDDGALSFVVAGGGPTGVELAGAITELVGMVLRKDHPTLDLTRVRVSLVEMADDLLPPYSAKNRRYAAAALADRGVELRTGTAIEKVEPNRVHLSDGSSIASRTVIWTAGVRAHPLADALGLEQTRGGRVVVGPDLRPPGRDDVFVIGDLAGATGSDGQLLPQLSPVAIQQGRFVARALEALQAGRTDLGRFRYFDKGTMATIGRNDAVAELPLGITLRGLPAWAAWLGVHLYFLIGFRNRAAVMLNWVWNYLTYDRGSRLILDPREPDRLAPERGAVTRVG